MIEQLYGKQVVAIDNRQEKLDEAPGCCEKILMDATEMTFPNNSFDHVTSFYTLMFMSKSDQLKALCEAERVVKQNGEIHIGDCNIDSAYPDPFITEVEVVLLDCKIKTTYGVGKMDAQSIHSIKSMCETAGLMVETAEADGSHFYIKCRKV